MADEILEAGQHRFDINASGTAQVNAFGTFTAETVNFGRQGSILSPNIDPVPPVGQLQKLRQEQTWIDRLQVQAFLQQRLIKNPAPLVELVGVAGSGKSMMVTWAFERILSSREQGGTGFDQPVWLNVGLKPSFQDLGRYLYQAIHLSAPDEQTSDQVLQRYLIAALIQRRYLVVIDQVEAMMATEAWPTLREFFEAWQRQGYNSLLLLTSREPVLPGTTHRLDFQGFTAEEGAEYLRLRGVPETGTVTLGEVATLAQGNPLLLQLVVTKLQQPTGNPFEQVVALFQRHLGSTETQVGKVFEILLGRLDPLHREMLLRVGVYRRGFDLAQAQAMVAATTAADLGTLAEQGFLVIQEGRWTLHPLVGELVGQTLAAAGWVEDSHQRAVAYFAPRLEQEVVNLDDILECFHHHCELRNHSEAFKVVSIADHWLHYQGYYRLLVELRSRLVAGWQAHLPQDIEERGQFAWSLNHLANAYYYLGEYRRAISLHEESLAIYKAIRERKGQAETLTNLGNAYHSLGEYQRAISLHEESLAISRKIIDRKGQADILTNLGNSYESLGKYRRAINLYEESLAINQEIVDFRGKAATLTNLGNAYRALGEYGRSITLYNQSLPIFETIGDRSSQASTLGNLGNTYQSLGEYGRAITLYEQSLPIFESVGDRNGQARALGSLGFAYCLIGEYCRAITLHEQSLAIFEKIENRSGQAGELLGLGNAYQSLGKCCRAITFYEQSLAIRKEIGNRNGQANALMGLGIAYSFLGEYRRAISLYAEALPIFKEIGDKSGQAHAFFNQALTLTKLDDHWGAQQGFEYARQLYLALDLPHEVEKCDRAIQERGQIIAMERQQAPAIGPDPAAPQLLPSRSAPIYTTLQPPALINRNSLIFLQVLTLVAVVVLVIAMLL